MIRTQYALCSNRVIRDAEENRISAIDIFENLVVPSFPIVIPRLSLIWVLCRDAGDPEENQATITLKLNDQTIFETDAAVNFQGGLSTRSITVIGGLALQAPGTFSAHWDIPGQATAQFQITVDAQPHVANEGGAVSMAV